LRQLLEDNPIIAAVKNYEQLKKAIDSDCEVIFLLYGDILNLKYNIDLATKNDKRVFVHLDMITGISPNPIIIDYLTENSSVDGIITTKTNIVKRAIEKNVKVIQRFFVLDSISLNNIIESLHKVTPDAIELMPGIMPKVIKKIRDNVDIPIIVGGLIETKAEVMDVLKSGALSVSTSKLYLWE
jgi:glycerol uptake operon antiterminator